MRQICVSADAARTLTDAHSDRSLFHRARLTVHRFTGIVPAYAIDSQHVAHLAPDREGSEENAGFLGDRDFSFDHLPAPRRRTRQSPASAQDDNNEEYNEALTYHNEEANDDNDDYVACIFQEWKLVMAESQKFDPEEITDDEIARLGVIVSEV
jgi:hypothetical protein